VATSGGAAVSICECEGRDYFWGDDDVILFTSPGEGLMRVSAAGGEPETLLREDTERLLGVEILPGEETLLTTTTFEGALWITSVSLSTPERKRLVQGHSAQYLEPGFLIFARGALSSTTLFAARFDAGAIEIRGELTPIAEDVISGAGRAAQFAIAENGTFVYARRPASDNTDRRLVWIDREGLTTPLLDAPAGYRDPRLSPDGSLLAYSVWGERPGLWVYDVVRGVRTLVQEGVTANPVWTPDGDTVTFVLQTASEGFAIYSKAADGSGEALQTVVEKEGLAFGPEWSPDGSVLFYYTTLRQQIRALFETGEVSSLVTSEGNVGTPRVSPDGRFIAYRSDTSGQDEVYVVPLPEADRRLTISTDGGDSPVWSRDGRELFYVSDDRLMTVAVETADGLRPGTAQELFHGRFVRNNTANYDVSLDGERFVMVQSESATEPRTVLHFVLHLDEELRQRLP
jgi:Tol biopolymer transport system component